MASADLPSFVLENLQRIAKNEGFAEGYEVKFESGSRVGDGFLAKLLAIKMIGHQSSEINSDLVPKELSLICKIQPTSAIFRENCGSAFVFQNEVYTYNVLLPALAAFQKERLVSADDAFTCFPKCFAALHKDGNSESLIVMEDLRAAGYEMWNKKNPVDYESVRLLMEQLGRLHGLSLAIRNQKPELFEEFQNQPPTFVGIMTSPGFSSMIQSQFMYAISLMDQKQDVETLQQLSSDFCQKFLDSGDAKLFGQYGVISHGDCWLNNMMYAMEEGLAKSIILLDWQMTRVSSPAIDLTHFLFSSTTKSLRAAHLDEFLQIYYSNMCRSIRASGSDPDALFPEAELQRQLRQFGVFGVVMSLLMVGAILADSSEISDLEEMAAKISRGESPGLMAHLSEEKAKKYAQEIADVLADARQYGWIL